MAHTSRVAVAATVLFLVAALVLLSLARACGGNAELPLPNRPGTASGIPSEPHQKLVSGTADARRVANATGVILDVCDGKKQPVPKAGVWRHRPGRIPYRLGDPNYLGGAGPDGRIALSITEPQLSLIVGKKGYISARVEVMGDGVYSVLLQQGVELRVCCLESGTGTPLEGVTMAVSEAPMPKSWLSDAAEYECGVAQNPGENPISVMKSAADGWILFAGLRPCKPIWRTHSPTYTCVDGPGLTPPDNTALSAPGSYMLEYAKIVVCGYKITGDTSIGSQGRILNVKQGGIVQIDTEGIRRALCAKHPDASIIVGARTGTQRPICSIRLQLALKGEQSVEVPFVDLERFAETGPAIINAATMDVGPGAGAVSIVVDLLNGDRHQLPGRKLFLRQQGESVKMYQVTSGELAIVPPGKYRVVAREETIQNSISPETLLEIVDSGTRHSIAMTRTLYHVEFQRGDVHGASSNVRLAHSNGGEMTVTFPEESVAEVYLPEGVVKATFETTAGVIRETEFVIRPGAIEKLVVPLR